MSRDQYVWAQYMGWLMLGGIELPSDRLEARYPSLLVAQSSLKTKSARR